MQLTLLNLTSDSLSFLLVSKSADSGGSDWLLAPSGSVSVSVPSTRPFARPTFQLQATNGDVKESAQQGTSRGCLIKFPRMSSGSPRMIPVPTGSLWRVYLTTDRRKNHRLLIFPRRDLDSFLADMPDTLPLSALCLPGTHNSMAFYGWPISQCQERSTPLSLQLQSGIRVIDVRLAIINSRLIAYHGIYPQQTPFQDVLSTIHTFLTDHPQETIVMSIKQEDFAKNSYLDFSLLVHEEMFNGPGGSGMWFLQNRIPRLGEVRGKAVLFSRFGGNGEGWEEGWEGLGIHPLVWPDSEKAGFSWQCKDTLVQTHDWYNVSTFLSIPEKFSAASQLLLPPPNDPPMPTLAITYLSASSFPLALPPTIAKGFGWPCWGMGMEGINSRFARFLLEQLGGEGTEDASDAGSVEKIREIVAHEGSRVRGWALLDYYADALDVVPLLVECNYRGRRKGEEGWP